VSLQPSNLQLAAFERSSAMAKSKPEAEGSTGEAGSETLQASEPFTGNRITAFTFHVLELHTCVQAGKLRSERAIAEAPS
jgi:hypothetical protein